MSATGLLRSGVAFGLRFLVTPPPPPLERVDPTDDVPAGRLLDDRLHRRHGFSHVELALRRLVKRDLTRERRRLDLSGDGARPFLGLPLHDDHIVALSKR